ncbi:MAG TPA: L,D-transpeptidase family protein [Candidatus Eisenbacteria bacterium]|jgi:UDP-N-acetylmuramate--alanine ligase
MGTSAAPALADRAAGLARAALSRPRSPFRALPARLLVVDTARQRLALVEGGRSVAEYPVSTAAAGIGGESGSYKTPPGWHRIHAAIGAGKPAGAVFVSRAATGEVWRGEAREDDLILTRVLTLDGLEEGVNRGSGRDSLERYIYLHGTNHEDALGRPASHGCVRLSNTGVIELFERVREGDPVLILEGGESPLPDPLGPGRFHFAGLGGSGMSALAQFQAMLGGSVSGSDRAFDRGERAEEREALERLGIAIHPQDGSGVGADCAALVVSTAIEEQVPDFAAAKARGIAIVHRSELLAHFVATRRTLAVSGTSGKSTVVAMAFEILRGAGRDPSVITGGELVSLTRQGRVGNAWAGGSDLLVVEADESDGSLVRYSPAVGVVLNLQRDHKEESEVERMFETFRARVRERLVVGEDENLAGLAAGASIFGFSPRATVRGEVVELSPTGSRFTVGGVGFTLAAPGWHNVQNAVAAIAACEALGVPIAEMAAPLAGFQGVARRFESIGVARGVEVVDDFAHNPAKIRAAIATARARAQRVLAVYQPHGYAPTRFLRRDFVETFAEMLRPEDRLWMLEVYYAGGTARRDFSAADIVGDIVARGAAAEFAGSRPWLVRRLAAEARGGDLVLVMGARDPSLTDLAREVLGAIAAG